MWCSSCQQDVPAVASPDEAGARCARCRQSLDGQGGSYAAHATAGESFDSQAVLQRVLPGPPLPSDDWELETDMRSALRLVNRLRHDAPSHPEPHAGPAPDAAAWQRAAANDNEAQGGRQRVGLITWALLSLGVMTFVCGGVLVAWSFAADRPDLRNLGLPLTLAGQAALIIGLVLQLEGLWQSSRQTRQTLSDLDDQLHELRHATTLLTSSHSAPGQSFYAHMADGASPQLLLADLKGQMDLLAQRMATQRRAA